jgi:hypothetical protein
MRPILAASAVLLAGMLAGASPASAQIIIDGFLNNTGDVSTPPSPNSVITNDIDGTNIDRQIIVEAAGELSILATVLDGFLVIDATGEGSGSASVEMDYLDFVINLSDNTFFEFDVSKVVGTPTLGLILGDANLGQITGGILLNPTDTPQSIFLDITQFAGYAPGFGSELNSVQILIGGADAGFFVQGDSFNFSAVPEPSSGLLLAAGLSIAAFRRRSLRGTRHES